MVLLMYELFSSELGWEEKVSSKVSMRRVLSLSNISQRRQEYNMEVVEVKDLKEIKSLFFCGSFI